MSRGITALAALAALIVAGCGGGGRGTTNTRASRTGKRCTSYIAIEGPFTGRAADLGLQQLHFAQLAVATDDRQLRINVSLVRDDTQLNGTIAVAKADAILSSGAVAVVGPASNQEVEAVGPLFARAGIAFVSGSATLPALADGANPTFFRVVPDDNVQGPQDASYIVNRLHPKAVLVIDDGEAYSQGLVKVMLPILQGAGIRVNHRTFNGAATGAQLTGALSSLVSSQLMAAEKVTVIPWQSAASAEQFGLDARQQHKRTTLFGTDGVYAPAQFQIPGSYVSAFGPDISISSSPLDKAIVAGVERYGPYGTFGVPTYAAADVVMRAISSVCRSGELPNRANVLAAIKMTDIPPADTPLDTVIKFQSNGDLVDHPGYLFRIDGAGNYIPIPTH